MKVHCHVCGTGKWWSFSTYVEDDATWNKMKNVWDDGWCFEWRADVPMSMEALGQFIKLWAQSTLTNEDQEKYRDLLWSGPGIQDCI